MYPWYILHQTITVTAGYYLYRLELAPATEGALLLIITLGGCALIHHYLVLRIRWLGPLMGYTPPSIQSHAQPTHRRVLSGGVHLKSQPARVAGIKQGAFFARC